jgi:hypothetical protein
LDRNVVTCTYLCQVHLPPHQHPGVFLPRPINQLLFLFLVFRILTELEGQQRLLCTWNVPFIFSFLSISSSLFVIIVTIAVFVVTVLQQILVQRVVDTCQ